MSTTRTRRPDRPAPRSDATGPAQRLLDTASKLFATQGIRAVGIDQILRESGVAKASLYSSYGSKDALVIAYLNELDQADRKRWETRTTDISDPADRASIDRPVCPWQRRRCRRSPRQEDTP